MYIKLTTDGDIEQYPYTIQQLRLDNATTSFPAYIPDERLAEWNVYPVAPTQKPDATYKELRSEDTPQFVNGQWIQVWKVESLPQQEIDILHEQLRADAYRNESDPLFFKWQRGEVEKQEWLDKVAEIKTRYSGA